MKKVMLFVILMAVMTAGCGDQVNILPEPTQEKIVKVKRVEIGTDPGIMFSCESADIDCIKRKVSIKKIKQFGSWRGCTWIGNLIIEGNELILELPGDAEYEVKIDKVTYLLPKM